MAGAVTSAVAARGSLAQSSLSQEQRQEYARQFSAERAGATPSELTVLREIQEQRIAVPATAEGVKRFLNSSPAMEALESGRTPELGMLMLWNGIALDMTSLDHTTDDSAEPPATYGEQFGPTRSSRALAIVHLSVFEAVNAIFRRYASYQDVLSRIRAAVLAERTVDIAQTTPAQASVQRAILEAAFTSLSWLHPSKAALLNAARAQARVTIGDSVAAQDLGAAIGTAAAYELISLRSQDGSFRRDLSADDLASNNPLDWQKDDISKLQPALGGNWHFVKTFAIEHASKFRCAPPPGINSAQFVAAYKEVKALGGDPNAPVSSPRWPTPTTRTGTQANDPLNDGNETFKGIFWAYDGTALLCAPPRLYNQVATSIALGEKPIEKVEEMARYLALVNVAMADTGIAAWESKYYYSFARPVTAIRRVSADATPEGRMDANWTPLGAPVSNGGRQQANLTPPFPAYPSGHAAFGGALFQIMRRYWGLPAQGVPFAFVSDEYNGRNRGPGEATPRPEVRRSFTGFDAAEAENGRSRVWLGIHWQFDADAGIKQGNEVAEEVFSRILQPLPS